MFLIACVALNSVACGAHKTEGTAPGQEATKGYFPGLGEMMKSLQYHHAKLFFAGKHQNWPLADFELHELVEGVEVIQKFHKSKPEIQTITRLERDFQALKAAIERKDDKSFQTSFKSLTQTCNNCHRDSSHGFIVITVPAVQPVANQNFQPLPK